jgi:hypothetical protein
VDNASLDDWIGKDVAVLFSTITDEEGNQRRTGCTLQSADQRGVILSYYDAQDLSKQQLWFFPWDKIEWIHRLTQ